MDHGEERQRKTTCFWDVILEDAEDVMEGQCEQWWTVEKNKGKKNIREEPNYKKVNGLGPIYIATVFI